MMTHPEGFFRAGGEAELKTPAGVRGETSSRSREQVQVLDLNLFYLSFTYFSYNSTVSQSDAKCGPDWSPPKTWSPVAVIYDQ